MACSASTDVCGNVWVCICRRGRGKGEAEEFVEKRESWRWRAKLLWQRTSMGPLHEPGRAGAGPTCVDGEEQSPGGIALGCKVQNRILERVSGGSVWFGDAVLLQVPLCYPTAASLHPLAARKGVAGSPEQPGMPVFSLVQSAHPALERAGSTPSGRGTTGTCWGEMKFLAAWLSAARMKTRPTL